MGIKLDLYWPHREPFNKNEDSIDVYATLEDGSSYVGTLVSPIALSHQVAKSEEGYRLASDEIVIDNFDPSHIEKVILAVIKDNLFKDHFAKEERRD